MSYELTKIVKLAWKRFNINNEELGIYNDLDWYFDDFTIQVKNGTYENTSFEFRKYFVTQMTDSLIYKNQTISKEKAKEYLEEQILK